MFRLGLSVVSFQIFVSRASSCFRSLLLDIFYMHARNKKKTILDQVREKQERVEWIQPESTIFSLSLECVEDMIGA